MQRFFSAIVVAISLSSAAHAVTLTEFLSWADQPWIELHNNTASAVSLQGFRLGTSDDIFVIGDRTLEPGSYHVFEIGDGEGQLPVTLGRRRGELLLSDPEGQVVSQYAYHDQREAVSFGIGSDGVEQYFPTPTPGMKNKAGVLGFVADTKFSIDGGFYNEPFEVAITCDTAEASIRYTLDGSEPDPFNPRTKIYQSPIPITTTTVLRAYADRFSYRRTDTDTQTYLFLNDVVRQPIQPDGFPQSWGNGPGVQAAMPAVADYEMDPEVRDAGPFVDMKGDSFTLQDALTSIPTMALAMSNASLFDPQNGLHALARNKGREWEREMSLEYFDEQGVRQFQVNGGYRMQGGWNRFPEHLKKSFRFYFREEYGDAKLKFPLFPDSPVTAFDTLILRSGNGKTWSSPWRPLTGSTNNSLERTTYLRDQLPRDLQRDMGHPTAHGRFVHLYINGLYWGLYNLVERVDEWFGPSYLGGDEEDYDVIKWIRSEGMVITAGDDAVWQQLLDIVRTDAASLEGFQRAAELLDIDNLIDYMLINFYIGNTDWPDNNSYTFRQRTEDGRFRFVCWDSEESLVSATGNVLGTSNATTAAELFQRLRRNEEFKVRLTDRIHQHFSQGGVLTDAHVEATFMARAREIDRAIVGESARWGDIMRRNQPYTRVHWLRELDNLRDNFFGRAGGSREEQTMEQMRSAGWLSDIRAPHLSKVSGSVARNETVSLVKASIFAVGQIVYTLDGTDPRLPGGSINPDVIQGAATLTIDRSLTVSARAYHDGRWSPLTSASYQVGQLASPDNLAITEIMYHPATSDGSEFLELTNTSTAAINLIGAQFVNGIRYHFEEDALLEAGERAVLVGDRAMFASRYGDSVRVLGEFTESKLNNAGERVTLTTAENAVISEIDYLGDSEAADGGGYSLVRTPTGAWRLSAGVGGNPGTSDAETFTGTTPQALIDFTLGSHMPSVARDGASLQVTLTRYLPADEVDVRLESSVDLATWQTTGAELVAEVPDGTGFVRQQWAVAQENARFVRVRLMR